MLGEKNPYNWEAVSDPSYKKMLSNADNKMHAGGGNRLPNTLSK